MERQEQSTDRSGSIETEVPTEAIENAVDSFNKWADRVASDGSGVLEEMATLSPLIHYHEPWKMGFIVVVDLQLAPVCGEYRDRWHVITDLDAPLEDTRVVYCEKVGSDPPVSAMYEPRGTTSEATDLLFHPVEGEGHHYRAVARDGSAVPRIELWVLTCGAEDTVPLLGGPA